MNDSIDLLLWDDSAKKEVNWTIGETYRFPTDFSAVGRFLNKWASQSGAEFGLFWDIGYKLPSESIVFSLLHESLDIAHAGLSEGLGKVWPSLAIIKQDWSMINAPAETPSTSWRMNLRHCLVRRSLILDLHGIDPAFSNLDSSGLDFAYRALKMGAIVEYRPALAKQLTTVEAPSLPLQDLYLFVLRHYNQVWAKYLLTRRVLANFNFYKEIKAFKEARFVCKQHKRPDPEPVSYHKFQSGGNPSLSKKVSVIIPTLGRYSYLPGALKSLEEQSVQPYEVIVVDQNPVSERQPQVYEGFKDLNLRVIWQDQQGQSLARNTGLAASHGEFVFLFDDDSIAKPDLIEQHLLPVLNGFVDVSTGVATPPPPTDYELPPEYRFPRLAQTFDTGNSLLPLALAKKMGGMDRNYDFGPGADADFGTRLYLAGHRILHNPLAVRIHFKAASGGLRVHGAYKYNTDAGIFAPFPPVTQSYYALRYMNSLQQKEAAWLKFVTNKLSKSNRQETNLIKAFLNIVILGLNLPFFSLKLHRSRHQAKGMIGNGIKLSDFDF